VNTLVIAGGCGGVVVLLGAIIAIGRGIFKQISATEENTVAVRDLTSHVARLEALYNGHETRIAVLEDRVKRVV
jgi:hypothetical protein